MKFRKYTKEQFIKAIKSSTSVAQSLKQLNVAPHGGNYATARSYIKQLKLDTSHMKRQGWNKGQFFGPKRPIEDYLSNKHKIQSNPLRKRLIKEGLRIHECFGCHRTSWKCFLSEKIKPIPLELDHIDGDRLNNNLSNLRLLCPTCHAMTPIYRGKNKKRLIV